MISGKRNTGATEEKGDRVILSLPADLAEKLLASELLAKHRDEIDIRRTDAATAPRLISDLD